MRPGQLIAAVTLSGFGLCVAGLIVLRHLTGADLGPVTTN